MELTGREVVVGGARGVLVVVLRGLAAVEVLVGSLSLVEVLVVVSWRAGLAVVEALVVLGWRGVLAGGVERVLAGREARTLEMWERREGRVLDGGGIGVRLTVEGRLAGTFFNAGLADAVLFSFVTGFGVVAFVWPREVLLASLSVTGD